MSDENQEAYQCGERALVNNHDTIRWKEATNDRKFSNYEVRAKGFLFGHHIDHPQALELRYSTFMKLLKE